MTREECIQEFIKIIDSKLEDVPFYTVDVINAKEKWLDINLKSIENKSTIIVGKLIYNDEPEEVIRTIIFEMKYKLIDEQYFISAYTFRFIDNKLEEIYLTFPNGKVCKKMDYEKENQHLEIFLEYLQKHTLDSKN
jgi:hypothetical protein